MDILLINFKEIFLKNYFYFQHDYILLLFNNLNHTFVVNLFINTGCIYICIKKRTG